MTRKAPDRQCHSCGGFCSPKGCEREHMPRPIPMESVLIDGVAYDTPAPVAAELLRLHIDALQPAQHIDSRYAPRLALALECMVLDPTRWSESSMALLDKYRAEWDRANPMPPTFMGEPV